MHPDAEPAIAHIPRDVRDAEKQLRNISGPLPRSTRAYWGEERIQRVRDGLERFKKWRER